MFLYSFHSVELILDSIMYLEFHVDSTFMFDSLCCYGFNVEWHSILSLDNLLEGFVLQ